MKKILILAANPTDTCRLRVDKEKREIDEGLRRAQQRDEFEIETRSAARLQDLRRALLECTPNIVHFCGHGEGEAGIIFENENGQTQLANTEALAGLFELFADSVECIVLNACYSVIQAEVIAQHIGYVIGMTQAIEDSTAVEFSVAFYDTLGAGRPIKFAYELACKAAQLMGKFAPTLLIRRSIATAFLAYSSEKHEVVEQIATALCQRGVDPWLDSSNLPAGTDFIEKLTTALRQKVVMVPVLASHKGEEQEASEVKDIFGLKKEPQYHDWIIPVYLESHDEPAVIADRISRQIYQRLNFKNAKDINVVIDQRGDGSRNEPYEFPQPDTPELQDALATLATHPTLVFRPDLGDRSRSQLLTGGHWEQFMQALKKSLSSALGNLTTHRVVRILGEFQLGIAFLLGQQFDRTTHTTLYCYNTRFNTCFDNAGQSHAGPLLDATIDCESISLTHPSFPEFPSNDEFPIIAVYIGRDISPYPQDVKDHLETESPRLPAFFIETIKPDEQFKDSPQVISIVRKIATCLLCLKKRYKKAKMRIYWDIPNNVLPLVSANLTWQVINPERIEFMERNPQASSSEELYVYLPMK